MSVAGCKPALVGGPVGALELAAVARDAGLGTIPALAAAPAETEVADEEAARLLAEALLAEGTRPSQAAKEVARRLQVPRNQAYAVVQSVQDRREGS